MMKAVVPATAAGFALLAILALRTGPPAPPLSTGDGCCLHGGHGNADLSSPAAPDAAYADDGAGRDVVERFRAQGLTAWPGPSGPRVLPAIDLAKHPQGVPVPFYVRWYHGADCASEPKIQIYRHDADTFILRQSLCVHYEAPFIYLLFGEDRVLMEDTGVGSSLPLAATVYGLINDWLAERGQGSIQLVVAHSHAHGDHIAFDSQFIGQPNTVVVGKSTAEVQQFFGIARWPTQIVEFELGGRTLSIIPIPGHQPAHIAIYDPRTQFLLTGDTLYPGRLYCPTSAFPTFRASIQRLVDFAASHPVSFVMGTHIEMSKTPGVDFPIGSKYHPNEHVLQLKLDHLLELHAALEAMVGKPFVKEVHDDFIIYPI
jgi:hydroxyacylglutathione hydrolase